MHGSQEAWSIGEGTLKPGRNTPVGPREVELGRAEKVVNILGLVGNCRHDLGTTTSVSEDNDVKNNFLSPSRCMSNIPFDVRNQYIAFLLKLLASDGVHHQDLPGLLVLLPDTTIPTAVEFGVGIDAKLPRCL